jgi:hypothetical protein
MLSRGKTHGEEFKDLANSVGEVSNALWDSGAAQPPTEVDEPAVEDSPIHWGSSPQTGWVIF